MRLAMIGTGGISGNHHRGISENEEIELAGVYDLDGDLARARAEEWGVPAFSSMAEIFADPSIVAVDVMTPAAAHVPVAIECLKAGRHVLVEKPVSTDPREIEELIKVRNETGLVVMPAHCYVYPYEFQRLHRNVRSGRLGNIRASFIVLAIPMPEEFAFSWNGVLQEQLIHGVYQTVALMGAPERVFAGKAEPEWETLKDDDQAWIVFEYPGGASAHLFATWAAADNTADPWSSVVKVLGSKGSGSYSWRTIQVEEPSGLLDYALPVFEGAFGDELRAFREVVVNGGEPISTLEDALLCSRLMEAAERAAEGGAAVARDEDGQAGW